MSGNVSNSYPGLAGGIEAVTGELIVDTGLINVKHFQVGLAQAPGAGVGDAFAAHGELQDIVAGATRKLKLVCTQDDATAATNAANVVWTAHQD